MPATHNDAVIAMILMVWVVGIVGFILVGTLEKIRILLEAQKKDKQ
jgi:hypothetical protein